MDNFASRKDNMLDQSEPIHFQGSTLFFKYQDLKNLFLKIIKNCTISKVIKKTKLIFNKLKSILIKLFFKIFMIYMI